MDFGDLQPLHVLGGQCVISDDPKRLLRTVLGSCVSACIYDPVRGIGGMNHFLLPEGGETDAMDKRNRYGDTAMRNLVDGLYSRGARRDRMLAKLYGGRCVKGFNTDAGASNAARGLSFLQEEDIRLVESSLGDNVARWVTFHPVSGHVVLKETPDIPLQPPIGLPGGGYAPRPGQSLMSV